MKKLFALLLAVVMVASMMTACKPAETQTTEPSGTVDPSAPAESTPAESQTTEVHENKIIYGSDTEIGGDFTSGLVSNGATDMMISALCNDYGTYQSNQDGALVENPTVLKEWTRTDNEDGSATYRVTINEGLVYNNGDPITAKDFVFHTILGCTPFADIMTMRTAIDQTLVGATPVRRGEAGVVPGLRLIDDYTLEMVITPDFAQYYYADTYANTSPWNMKFWIGEGYDIVDDGEGCYMTLNGEKVIFGAQSEEGIPEGFRATTKEENDAAEATFRAAMEGKNGYVSAGPYSLVKFDAATGQATLEINPNYAGNFEGQKPSIETIVIVRTEKATWADKLKTGEVDLYCGITDGANVNTVLDLIDNGAPLKTVKFDRSGYGKIQFLCDVGPTQFKEVRHAVAHLLDREAFVNTFCKGWGTVVNGPFGSAMPMYKANKQALADGLNAYPFNVDEANKQLDEGGWTLNENGEAWDGTGLRYKDVTGLTLGKHSQVAIDAGAPEDIPVNTEGCKEVNGKLLMPLQIQWACTEGNPVSDLLAIMLANADAVTGCGMKIVQNTLDFPSLLNALYHQDNEGNAIPAYYGMANLATNFNSAIYDMSYNWSDDPGLVAQGFNGCYLYDMEEGGLDQLSMDMVYDVQPGDDAKYNELWLQYILRWNDLLPELPLYANIIVSALPVWVEGYEENSFWKFEQAILYASIPSAQ